MVLDAGFEPATPTMSMWCSTPELTEPSFRGGETKRIFHGWQCLFYKLEIACLDLAKSVNSLFSF